MMGPFAEPEYDWDSHESADGLRADTSQADAQRHQIVGLLRESGEFFIEFYLGEELTMPVPTFHTDIWKLMCGTAVERILLAIPRDHAKTTLSKLNVIWHWLFTGHRFCAYVSNTNSRAKDACRDIVNFLKTQNHIAVFGSPRIIKESETESLWIFELQDANGRWKKCILRAIGAGQSMRGINVDNQRPDFAVVDDLEDDDNTATPQLQKKLDKWVYGPFIKALARKKKIIWLGNMLSQTSLLARMSKNPVWNPVVFGCLVRNNVTGELQPLWPDRWPMEELIKDFQEYREMGLVETWMCEMMNMPGHGVNGFHQDQITYRPTPAPDGILAAWICIDPAFGENASSDDTSITCHVLPEDGPPMVVAHRTGKFSESEMFEHAFQLALYWNAWVWGIESIAAQRVLITLFNVYFTLRGMMNSCEMLPLMAGAGDPKLARIRAWIDMMAKREYAIYEGAVEITSQILSLSMTKKQQRDDLVDSCAYGPTVLANYQPLLLAKFQQGYGLLESPNIQHGRSVAGV